MKAFDYTNAVRESDLPAPARWVYVALVLRYNHTRNTATWVSQETLSKDTGFSVATVYRALKRLQESGWVDVRPRSGKTNLYAPLIGTNPSHSDVGHGDLGKADPSQSDVGVEPTPVTVTDHPRQSDVGGTSERRTNREVSSETNKEVTTPASPVAPEEPTPSTLPSLGDKQATDIPSSPSPVGQAPIKNTDPSQSDGGSSSKYDPDRFAKGNRMGFQIPEDFKTWR